MKLLKVAISISVAISFLFLAECGGKKCHSFASCNNNTNTCECTKVSNDTISQVCGNDGITYNNEENLMYKSCISTNFDVRKKHDGKCSRGNSICYVFRRIEVSFKHFLLSFRR